MCNHIVQPLFIDIIKELIIKRYHFTVALCGYMRYILNMKRNSDLNEAREIYTRLAQAEDAIRVATSYDGSPVLRRLAEQLATLRHAKGQELQHLTMAANYALWKKRNRK